MDHDTCCAYVNAAFSSQQLDSGALFFWKVLGGGVPCSPCKETCEGVECGEGKRCVLRNGTPKCVCSPDCRGLSKILKGPVCGTDGRKYKSACRLRKRACRTKKSNLSVAYAGPCQRSCDKINCPNGKYCLLDQNLTPHCVKCSRHCADNEGGDKQVCGTDGVTYRSPCYLKEAACKKGKAIPIAYRGQCFKGASCRNIQCKERQVCLTDPMNGEPRCVTCSYKCPNVKSQRETGGTICGTNNRTYISWCHMLKDSCSTGFLIETKFPGSCQIGEKSGWNYQHHNKVKNKKKTGFSSKEAHSSKESKTVELSSSNQMDDLKQNANSMKTDNLQI
ncbi:follistatin isoform X2 [Cimex lectularius]|nr:follistatin isoform X2 [Cimex lectularius]